MSALHLFKLLVCVLFIMQLSGCASPSQRIYTRAAELGYRRVVVRGEGFEHVAYINAGQATDTSTLHVYLEGDGTPWVHKRVASADPTPHTPLMLELMALDPAPSVYLGRPCYHGLNKTKACTSDLWTDKRYSEAVVASMSSALNRLSTDYSALVLLGHSGGGAIAMLLAERLPKTEVVITIAANLDTARWAALHKQQPLSGSLNPATRPPLPPRIRQMHFAGSEDDNVPPTLVREAITRQHGAEFKIFPEEDHACCWRKVWPEILGKLAAD
jgi:predicted alpha/beta hydrolase family esterase